jgi:hypothetical protein
MTLQARHGQSARRYVHAYRYPPTLATVAFLNIDDFM